MAKKRLLYIEDLYDLMIETEKEIEMYIKRLRRM